MLFGSKCLFVYFCRKALAVAAAALIAGGGLAYAQSSFRSRHLRQECYNHSNGTGTEKETPIQNRANNPVASKIRKKKNGLKSLKALAGILLAQMGRKGTHNLLFLAAIVVRITTIISCTCMGDSVPFSLRKISSFFESLL
jgi:hypothetical protein